jgi:putative spermidine/putrescine transport system substrate-binding protein
MAASMVDAVFREEAVNTIGTLAGLAVGAAGLAAGGAVLAQDEWPDLTGKKVVWADNGGTVHETYVKAYLEPFAEKTGAEVLSDSPFDYARIKAQVEAGNVTQDIITGAPYVIEKNCDVLFEPIPPDFDGSQVDPKYLTGKCAIPQSIPVFLVMYNKAMYPEPPTSCADFFDLEKFPGKRGIWTSVIGNGLEIALLGDGVPPEQVYPMDVERALAKLATIKDDIAFFNNLGVGSEGMTNGTYGMLITASTRAYDGVVAGADYAPLWDCAVEQISTLGVVKGTPNAEAAFALAEYIVTPEAQSARMAITSHSPVTTTYTLPGDALRESYLQVSHPGSLLMDNAWWAENFDAVEQRFQQWQVE